MLIIVSGFHKGARWSKSFVVIGNMGPSFLLGPARFFPTKLMVQTPNSSQLLCQREECFQWFWQQLSDKYVLNSVVKTKKGTRSFQSLFVNSQVYSGFIDRAWGEQTWLDNGLFFLSSFLRSVLWVSTFSWLVKRKKKNMANVQL